MRSTTKDGRTLPEDELAFQGAQRRSREDVVDTEKEDEFNDRLRVNLSSIDPTHPYAHGDGGAGAMDDCAIPRADLAGGMEPISDDAEQSDPQKRSCQMPTCLRKLARIFNFLVPYGGLLSSVFNLSSATLGAGIISTPSAFNLSGVVMAIIFLLLVLVGTIYSLYLIARVVERTGYHTFTDAARGLLGPGADYFLAALLIILCFGGSISYVIATGTLLVPVLNQPGAPAYLKTKSGNRLMTSLVWLVLMLPLAIPKQINSLRYVSTFGIFFLIYFVFCMVAHSAQNGLKDPSVRSEMVMVRTGNAALEGLGVLMFALLSQINAFEICHEMRPFTVFRFTLYSTIAMTGCAIMYFLAGFFGYADFGSRVTDSVLRLYDPTRDPYIAVGYVGMLIKISVAFALHMIPFRDAVYHLIRWKAETVPYWRHALCMTALCTLALICGLFIPNINTVFGLMGSFCGGIIGMIMPCLMFMYCGGFTIQRTGVPIYVATYLLLIGGCVAVVFGTTTTIYSTVQSSFG